MGMADPSEGVLTCLVTNPVFLIKTRMSLQMREKVIEGRPHYTGVRHAFMQIYRDEGFLGFYKGGVSG